VTCKRLENSEFQDLVALAACGEVDDQVKQHLLACPSCRRFHDRSRAAFLALGHAVPELEPPTRLKARILQTVQGGASREPQSWKQWSSDVRSHDLLVRRGGQADWQSTAFEGVEICRLFSDPAADRLTMMVRMAPGSVYPPHVHGGPEECYVLSGELKVGEDVLKAGDYQRAGQSSTHVTQSTDTGCLLLISSSYHDELFTRP